MRERVAMFGHEDEAVVPTGREIVPFAIAAAIGLAAVVMPGPPTDWGLFAAAVAITAALAAVAAVLPRLRSGGLLVGVLPLAYLLVVALLRHASQGSVSGFMPLVMLPVVWLALYGTWRQMAVGLLALALTFLLPYAIFGEPRYTASSLRNTLLWITVAALTGLVIGELLSRTRASRDRLAGVLRAATGTAIVGTDTRGIITVFNVGAERMLGWSAGEMIGRRTAAVLHDPVELAERAAQLGVEAGPQVFAAARGGGAETGRWTYVRKDGERLQVTLTVTAEHDAAGRVIGFLGVATDVTERDRALEAAMEASRAKSEFVANMSHEIRTPLNGVIGMLELLRGTGLTAEQLAYARTAESSGDALLTVVDDILDFSKIEAGRLDLDEYDFDVRRLVEDTCDMLAAQAHGKDLELTHWIGDDVPALAHGDGGRLRQVLTNLLSNAVKFTASGEVRVTVRCDAPARMRFEVCDTGIGIAPERVQELFEPFAQADVSTTRRYGGTGLGLAIARRLVGLMDGEIGAASQPGAGSTFWFTVPLGEVAEARATRRARVSIPVRGRVLVAEDNAVNQLVITGMLAKRGLEADVVADGAAAVAALRPGEHVAVFMDCQMPVLDGYEATGRIRAAEAPDEHVVVIAMTAHAMAGDRERCLAAGMDDYLAKPVRAEELDAVIERWLDGGLVDAGRIAALRDDYPEMADQLVDVFENSTPSVLDALRAAAERADAEAVGRAAHRLKGSCQNMGATAMAAASEALEHDGGDAVAAAQELDALFARTARELRRIVA